MKPSDEYLKTLLRYYEEEVSGEYYFRGLAAYFDEKEKLILLAMVERRAAESVCSLIKKYRLTPKSNQQLKQEGQGHVLLHESYTWSEFIEYIIKRYPGYLNDFANLKAMAPEDDWPQLDVLTQHEVAAIEFAQKEHANDPESIQPLLTYLQQ